MKAIEKDTNYRDGLYIDNIDNIDSDKDYMDYL